MHAFAFVRSKNNKYYSCGLPCAFGKGFFIRTGKSIFFVTSAKIKSPVELPSCHAGRRWLLSQIIF